MKEIKLPQDDYVMPEETPREERDEAMVDAYSAFNPDPNVVTYTIVAIGLMFVIGALFIN
jgi:hypothetical protein